MSREYLVVRLGSFGDVLLTTGVLTHWHETLGYRFIVVTKTAFSDIFKDHPAVEKVIQAQSQDLTAAGWRLFCRKLKNKFPSMGLVDLHGNLRTLFLRIIWKGKVFGYPKMGITRRLYARTGFKVFQARLLKKNVPQRYAWALSKNIQDQSLLLPKLYLNSGELLEAKEKLTRLGLGENIICLHPYATHQAKAWPSEKWKELISLLEKKDLDWIVIGQNHQKLLPSNSRDLTSQTTIRETGAIISNCRVLITGDSGPMHLASAVGTPVIGLFGPTSREWGFYPSGLNDIIIEAELQCRPCSLHGKSFGKCLAKCMDALEPQQVINTLDETC
jgi:ADP-heptose:LPS heptosyltransferase